MALQARRFFIDVQARQFVSSPDANLPASDPAWFEEDVESIELYALQPTGAAVQTWYAGISYIKNDDSFDFKFGEQLGIVQGSINYNLPTSYDWQTDTTGFTSGSASAQSSQTPKVIELAYNKQLSDSWNLNTNSRYTFVGNDNILTANIGVEYTW